MPIVLAGRLLETRRPPPRAARLTSTLFEAAPFRGLISNPTESKAVLSPLGYLDLNKREKGLTHAQLYLRQKSALFAAEKLYTPEEFEQLLADLHAGLISVQIYDEGIIVDRPARRCTVGLR